LLRAGSDTAKRAEIEDEMRDDAELADILSRLQHKRVAGERAGTGAALDSLKVILCVLYSTYIYITHY
jgi:hypothetical protein